jgi:hypothetical protein
VSGVVATDEYFSRFKAKVARCRPAVPLDTATAYFDPTKSETDFSN